MTNQCKEKACTRNAWANKLCRKHFKEFSQRESSIETKCCNLAREAGYLAWKFTSPGRAGVPDRVFMGDGRVFFVEFKKRGGKPDPLQVSNAELLTRKGIEVYSVDSIAEFKRLI